MENVVKIRNKIHSWYYRNILKKIFFAFDPEFVHKIFIRVGQILGSNFLTKSVTRAMYGYKNNILRQKINGIEFSNPVGLSAGFDKNAQIISVIEDVGFGFSEVGSVTAKSNSGNTGRRLERVIDKKSLWVNFGLNNRGADEIASRLLGRKYKIPFGVSIAKTNCKESADDKVGRDDYIYSLKKFNSENVGNFFVLNISCPNAYGGQPFSRREAYESLLKEVKKLKLEKAVFVKLSPDLKNKNIDEIIKISEKYGCVDGFIISNLTKQHKRDFGGLSGKYLEKKSNEMLKYVYKKTKGKYVLVGVGGIFSAEDAYKKIKLGASLVELITGMIYEGPSVISDINLGLVELLKKDGYKNISEAVGKGIV